MSPNPLRKPFSWRVWCPAEATLELFDEIARLVPFFPQALLAGFSFRTGEHKTFTVRLIRIIPPSDPHMGMVLILAQWLVPAASAHGMNHCWLQ